MGLLLKMLLEHATMKFSPASWKGIFGKLFSEMSFKIPSIAETFKI